MKKCIVQYWIPADKYSQPDYNKLLRNQPLHEISSRSFKKYCAKYNIDYIEINEPKINWIHPTFERFDLWLDEEWWQKYDQILYADSDIFAMPWAPDIFEMYPDNDTFKYCHFSKIENAETQEHFDTFYHGLLKKECSLEDVRKKGFQPGLFILTKKSRDVMRPWIEKFKEIGNAHDGEILNWANIKSNVKITKMDEWFNYKNAHFRRKPKIYFFHAAGNKKGKSESQEGIREYLKKHGV